MTATTEKIGTLGGFTSLLDDSHIFQTMTKKDYPAFVTKTIRLLSSNSGLKLIFTKRAEEACFNAKTKIVRIPPPPAFPSSLTKKSRDDFKHELDRWRGILNHEVGHAMFTIWKSEKIKEIDSKKKLYPQEHHMFNDLFENGRMERVVCEYFPGMLRDLQKLEGFLGEIIKGMYEKNPEKFNHIYYALRMVVNGYEPVTSIPEKLREDWDVVREMAKEAWDTNNEAETYNIARNIETYLKERYEEEKAKKEEEKKKEKELKEKLEKLKEALKDLEDEGDSEPGESDEENTDEESGEGTSTSSDKNSENNEDSEGEESSGSCKMPWEEEDEKETKPSKPSYEEEEDDDDTESDKAKDEKSEEDKTDEEKAKRKEEIEKEIEEAEKEIEKAKESKEEAEEKANSLNDEDLEEVDPTETYEDITPTSYPSGSDVVPLPFDDYVKNITVEAPKHSETTKEILDECMGAVTGMAQRFIQKVRSRVHTGVRTYRGRVNRRKLHRYKFDKNIFKTQNLRKKKDASVMIIVDCSGSMSGEKIETARKAALVVGEIMSRAKVEFEIRGFTIPFLHPLLN